MAKSRSRKKDVELMADPTRLAEGFLCDYVWSENEDDLKPNSSFHTLRRWREEFYLWKDGRYIRVADDTIKQHLTNWLQGYAESVQYQDHLHIPIKTSLVNNVLLNLQPIIHIQENQKLNTFLDKQDRGRFLCLENGLLHLDSRQLMPHTPNYFTTVCLPYPYEADAECPEFSTFLQDVMLERQDRTDLLQEFTGYLFRPDLREQKFLLCVGEGANGKTCLFDVIRALVGVENCSEVPISCFGDRFALYGTIGKVANLTHESSSILEDQAENILKSYVSGDRMSIDRKHKDPVEVTPTAKLLIATNNLPRFGDKSQAIWRRILLVPFELILKDKYQIRNKAEILKRELPGILNWALDGLDRLNAKGFTIPEGQQELMEEYRRDADPARAFLLDNYEDSLNGTYVPCAELYRSYKTFCESNGCHATNERNFGRQVARLFPGIRRRYLGPRGNREYVYEGLCAI